MKTKTICFALSTVLTLSMVGCGNKTESNVNTQNSNVSINTQTEDSVSDSSNSTDSQTEPSDSTNTPTDSTTVQGNSSDSTAGNTTEKPIEKPIDKPAVKPTKPITKPAETPSNPSTKPQEKPQEKPQTVILSATQVFDKIISGIEIPSMSVIDDQMFKDKYGIDLSLLDSYIVKKPMISVNASLEMSVLKVKDSKDIQTVIDAINKRGTAIAEQEAWYPMEQELAQNRKIVSKGNYVILVILNDADTIVKNFNDLIKE